MYATQQSTLPVSYSNWDPSTFNSNLPNGNDVWPQIQFDQRFNMLAGWTVSNFRKLAQERCGKSPLHTFAYNLLSQNRFSNEVIQKWCQVAVDFATFLMVAQNNSQGDAALKAATKIYISFVATCTTIFPEILHQVDQNARNQLPGALQEFQCIIQDVTAFQNQQRMGGAGGYGGGSVMAGGASMPNVGNNNSYHAALLSNAPNGVGSVQNGGTPAGRSSGMLLDTAATQSWDARSPTVSNTHQQGGSIMSMDVQTEQPQNFAQRVEDLILDPYNWTPNGFVVDKLRPFDEFYNAGGIEIRPAFLTKGLKNSRQWQWTAGEDQPYRKIYDPEQYVLFLAKWPDGRVKEVVVAARPEMEYLLHEINDELRRKAIRPKGLVVARTDGIIDGDTKPVPLEQLVTELDGHVPTESQLKPVIIDRVFGDGTDQMNELAARSELRATLGIDYESALPAHEYISCQFHPVEISEEVYEACFSLKDYNSFEAVAAKLKAMLDANELPVRVFRFMDRRLTDTVNEFLADSLSLSLINIDSFVEDVQDLSPYLLKKKGESFQAVFDASVPFVLGHAITFAEMDEEDLEDGSKVVARGLIDQFVNFQVGWTQQDLESLEITKEAKLISQATHPRIRDVVFGMIERAKENDRVLTYRLRVVTGDGIYYEVIRGKLSNKAVLMKRL